MTTSLPACGRCSSPDRHPLVARSRRRPHPHRYIRRDDPRAALRVAREICRGIETLRDFPNQGRPGRVKGMRELVFAPLPFVAVYRIREKTIEVVRLLHGAQLWPPG
ncbi:MAG: type II toxin-antitoxin system RelE/ParE family toxin [Acidobacteria bacterium]|nr:type II toxin-antitoxin system RelE/ParE family toxin [Acidobacteriota bacterium]